jgi:hypothetical protein
LWLRKRIGIVPDGMLRDKMIHTRTGKKLRTHEECYEAGFMDAVSIYEKEIIPEHMRKMELELSDLRQQLDTIETGQREELEALVAWSDMQEKRIT